jgi:hypothetical protein
MCKSICGGSSLASDKDFLEIDPNWFILGLPCRYFMSGLLSDQKLLVAIGIFNLATAK